jgi:phage anti-repressor protein
MQTCVDIALTASEKMLTVVEFIAATNYPIDIFMIDKFWNTMEQNRLIYVDDELISWMGYSAIDARNRKKSFNALLTTSQGVYYEYNNLKYQNFINSFVRPITTTENIENNNLDIIKYYPPLSTCVGKGKTKHLLLEPDCLRNIMMRVNTAKGDQVRKYYIDLERLFKAYITYQTQYQIRQSELQLRVKEAELAEKTRIIQEKDKQLNHVGNYAQELIKYKLFTEKSETIYIVSTVSLARQGLFKVGRTKNLPQRKASYNTAHPAGDEVIVLKQVMTCDSQALERRLTHVLKHFRPIDNREFCRIPFVMLSEIVDLCSEHLNGEEDIVNQRTLQMATLLQSSADINWAEGIEHLLTQVPAIVDTQVPINTLVPPVDIQVQPVDTQVQPINTPNDPQYTEAPLTLGEVVYRIEKYKLTDESASAIVEKVLSTLPRDSIQKFKIINELVRNQLKPKTYYKAAEWKTLIIGVAQKYGITLRAR